MNRDHAVIIEIAFKKMVKHLPAMRETRVRSLGRQDPLEKEMATYSTTLAWKIPWTEESGRLQSMGSQRVRHDWTTSLSFFLYSIPDSFVDSNGYSIYSKGFLPSVVDIMVQLNSPIPVHFSSLISKILMFTLAISFLYISFCLFILFIGFSRQEYWCGLPFPSLVDHVLSELSTMTHLLGWLHTAWLIASVSYTRLWSMWSEVG